MSNPLFQQATQGRPSKIQAIRQMMGTLRGQDPNKIIPLLMQKNPQFARFAQECKGKTPSQVAAQYGINLDDFKGIF